VWALAIAPFFAGCVGCSRGSSAPAPEGPVNSDLASRENGGGCTPSDITSQQLGELVVLNPEWAPVVDGQTADSDPVTLHGSVVWSHSDTGGDFPATHVRSDVNAGLELDAADLGRLATGNMSEDEHLELEWEAGAWPAWVWPSVGDRVVAQGRWIFDCGHADPKPRHCTTSTSITCTGNGDCPSGDACSRQSYGFQTELHPPQAIAVIRSGHGAILDNGSTPVPVTQVSVFASPNGGGAGDRCVVTHRDLTSQLITDVDCYPLSQPIARFNAADLVFDVPLPEPKPAGGTALWRVVDRGAPGGVPAAMDIIAHQNDATPHLEVHVKLSQRTSAGLPSGFASMIYAGWKQPSTPLTHLRVTIDSVIITNPLKPFVPVVHDVRSWRLQARVAGDWQELTGLDQITKGATIAEAVVFDEYLPSNGALDVYAEGTSEACIDTLFGKSIKTMLMELGFSDMLNCIQTSPHEPGAVDASYPGPDFGAGPSGMASYSTASQHAPGGNCSSTSNRPCIDDTDCPMGELCQATGTAFTLSYTIQRLTP
jgi:hypothetical protein